METGHVAQCVQHLQCLPVVEQPEEIKGIGRREMGCLIKRETSQDCIEPVRKIARERDFRRTRKERAVKRNIISERSVELSMCDCWPKAQSKKCQHQSEENAVLAPESIEPPDQRTIHERRKFDAWPTLVNSGSSRRGDSLRCAFKSARVENRVESRFG